MITRTSRGSDGKVSAYNAGDLGSNPGLGRSPGEGNGTPLQYSCLENPMEDPKLPTQGAQVHSLLEELRSCMPLGQRKRKKNPFIVILN